MFLEQVNLQIYFLCLSFIFILYLSSNLLELELKSYEEILIFSIVLNKRGITVVIGTHARNINTRAKWHNHHFLKSGINQYPPIHPAFTTNVPFACNFTQIVVPQDEYKKLEELFKTRKLPRKNTQIGASLSYKHSALHFLYNTTDNWLIRIDDDAAFYLPNLQKALNRLNKYYNASKPYIFGSYVTFGKAGFLGGGGGYIFSRGGAKLFLEYFDKWVNTMYIPNDVHINQIIKLFNMTFLDTHFPGVTSEFYQSFYSDMVNKIKLSKQNKQINLTQYFSHEPCVRGDKDIIFHDDNLKFNRTINPSLIGYSLNDIFIYHHYWDFNRYNTTWDDVIREGFPEDAFYYHCNTICHICKPNNINQQN